jgi:hypothetical protein
MHLPLSLAISKLLVILSCRYVMLIISIGVLLHKWILLMVALHHLTVDMLDLLLRPQTNCQALAEMLNFVTTGRIQSKEPKFVCSAF